MYSLYPLTGDPPLFAGSFQATEIEVDVVASRIGALGGLGMSAHTK